MAHMSMKQARALRDGILKGDSNIAKAWREMISGEVAASSESLSSEAASPDTATERKALGIPEVEIEEAW